jgi:hypothetical protein
MMFVPSHAGLPAGWDTMRALEAASCPNAAGGAEPNSGAGPDERAGAASPSALETITNDRGNRSTSPTGPKNSRAASWALA